MFQGEISLRDKARPIYLKMIKITLLKATSWEEEMIKGSSDPRFISVALTCALGLNREELGTIRYMVSYVHGQGMLLLVVFSALPLKVVQVLTV